MYSEETHPRWIRIGLLAATACGLALQSLAQVTDAKLLLAENAYNPIPSPDGRYIAYVGKGCDPGTRRVKGMGRPSTDLGLMESSGKVLTRCFAHEKFLAGWTSDSKGVLCYRGGFYAVLTPGGVILEAGEQPDLGQPYLSERVAFLNDIHRPVWLTREGANMALQTGSETLLHLGDRDPSFPSTASLIAPSRDGRYIAMVQESSPPTLWVYDRRLRHWANLGNVTISPDQDWYVMNPAWDPWFADGARLVFFSGRRLFICSPDGKTKRVLLTTDRAAGLATPSPNGKAVAFVTFKSRPREYRPDLKLWGNAAVWVVSTANGSIPRRLTKDDPDTSTGLRWLGNDALVFDRISEYIFEMHARIWQVAVR